MWHGKLLTNVHITKRNLTSDDTCPICHKDKETLAHLFRDCPNARAIWSTITLPNAIKNVSSLPWMNSLMALLHCPAHTFLDIKWCNLFVFICWYIWKWRNKLIFFSHFQWPSAPSVIISAAVNEWNELRLR